MIAVAVGEEKSDWDVAYALSTTERLIIGMNDCPAR
jgi:hypothetical protein